MTFVKKKLIFARNQPKNQPSRWNMSQDLCLDQIVNTPTRGTAILDLIFTNRPDIAKKPQIIAGLGDHDCVTHEISLKIFRKKPIKREILLWTKADNENIINDCKSFRSKFFETFNSESNVIEIWDFIKTEIQKIIKKNVPSKETTSKQHQPWINTKTKQLIRKKQRWYSGVPIRSAAPNSSATRKN